MNFVGLFLAGVIGAVCIISAIFFKQKKKESVFAIWIIGCVFFSLGFVLWIGTQKKLDKLAYEEKAMLSFVGTIYEVEEKETTTYYYLKIKQINKEKIGAKIRIELKAKQATIDEDIITNGCIIYGTGSKKEFMKATNPGGFDEQSYQYGKGVFLALENVEIKQIEKSRFSLPFVLRKTRNRLEDIYEVIFEEREASLSKAMVLGNKSELEQDIKELYQRNGIAHLIAISGLHIAMIGGTLYQFIRKRIGSYPVSACFAGTFILLYGGMTGFSGSTIRAVIMLLTMIGADVFGRKYDTLSAIALALLLMLINNVFLITQVSFLLSFGAVLGIALIFPIWKEMTSLPKIFDGLGVSLCVQLMLLPVMLYFFYEISVYGIFLNIIVVPLMSILLAILILCAVIGNISLILCSYVAIPANLIFMVYEKLCEACEKLPFHTLCTGRPTILWIMIYYIVIGQMLIFYKLYKKKGVAISLLFVVLLVSCFNISGRLKVCMFDVGQGDGIYIETPNHTRILMDGGSSSKKKIGKYVLQNGLKFYGGNVLDYVMISHSDSDHYSGIKELLEGNYITIKNVILPAIANPDEAYLELVALAKQKGCKVIYMKKGECFHIGEVSFTCLNPKPIEYMDKNQGSLVFWMNYKKFDMLFTGDMDKKVEAEILYEVDKDIEILKVAHHGSETASSADFLQRIKPDISIVSVGENNRYGHPAKDVMERLETFSKKIYLTKDSGAITIETDGNQYSAEPFMTE